MHYRGQHVALIVPCYNEESAIESVVYGFREALPEIDIYVFDNNSSDRTAQVAEAAGAKVISVKLPGKGNVVRRMFADVEADIYVMVDGDATYEAGAVKSLVDKLLDNHLDMVVGCRKTKEEIEDAMLAKGYRRDCCVIAVGGGVVTDLAGFLAGTFGRGVPVIHYATTLLAAADASIGGKTAVDTDLATNLIGLIYQPKKVYVDIDAWKTLPKRHLINGLAETIKHACLADYELFTYLEEHWQDILSCDKEACTYISEHNCKVKYEVVMKDEKENNLREILNLGHTVGRAIETVSDYRLLHGEALSIGMTAQVLLGYRSGYLSKKECERVITLQQAVGLPVRIPEYIDREELVKKLYTDKKVRDGRLRFVFQKGIGDVMTFGKETYARCVSEEEIRAVLMDDTVL